MPEIVNVKFELPEPEHRALKVLVAERRTNIKAVLVQAVREYLAAARQESGQGT